MEWDRDCTSVFQARILLDFFEKFCTLAYSGWIRFHQNIFQNHLTYILTFVARVEVV